jgi:cytochrome-b5 reductase
MNSIALVLALITAAAVATAVTVVIARRTRTFLNPDVFKAAELIEKETVTHNAKRFRFALPPRSKLGLPVGQHVSFKFTDCNGKDVMRSYTPVTGDETRGHVDFVIKVYPQGKMSQHLNGLELGNSIQMRGPKGRLTYMPNMKRELGATVHE